jgi:hypothetical protein
VLAENVLVYDEHDVKITLNKIEYSSSGVIKLDADAENNSEKQYYIFLYFRANNTTNDIISGFKAIDANSTGKISGYERDSYIKKYDIKNLDNMLLFIKIMDGQGTEVYTKTYRFDDNIKDIKKPPLGEKIYSNDKVEVWFVGFYNPTGRTGDDGYKLATFFIKNMMGKEYNFWVGKDLKINGEEPRGTMFNREVENGEYGLAEVYFTYSDDVSTIKTFEFNFVRQEEVGSTKVTDNILIKK